MIAKFLFDFVTATSDIFETIIPTIFKVKFGMIISNWNNI
jgi:hypothetical protein